MPAQRNSTDPLQPSPEIVGTLLTVRQFTVVENAFSEGSVRWSIFNADTNGLAESGALVRVGRRRLIDPKRYIEWARSDPPLSPKRNQGVRRAVTAKVKK
jgi:hypothetical protein